MDLSKLTQKPTEQQRLDYQAEVAQLLISGKQKGLTIGGMAEEITRKVFADVKDLSEENTRLGMALKQVQQKSSQGSLL